MAAAIWLVRPQALAELDGDLEGAVEYLRKKGLASAAKKAGRVAAEGCVASYIHAGARRAAFRVFRV